MHDPAFRVIAEERPTLDEDAVMAVLARHFPAAETAAIRHAAQDVLLLEMLLREEGLVWEDAMCDPLDRGARVKVLHSAGRGGS